MGLTRTCSPQLRGLQKSYYDFSAKNTARYEIPTLIFCMLNAVVQFRSRKYDALFIFCTFYYLRLGMKYCYVRASFLNWSKSVEFGNESNSQTVIILYSSSNSCSCGGHLIQKRLETFQAVCRKPTNGKKRK